MSDLDDNEEREIEEKLRRDEPKKPYQLTEIDKEFLRKMRILVD